MTHAIRLREPWSIAQLPDETLELRRRFQCPPAVRAAQHVWLNISDLPGAMQVSINSQPVVHSARLTREFRQDIRALVQAHNELVIRLVPEVGASTSVDRILDQLRHDVLAAGLVRLEIE